MTCPECRATNAQTARFCNMCGASLAPSRAGHERRRVSVVFIDLAGFSSLTHDFDPEDLRDLADEILTVVAGIVEDFDGYVDAFRGDGLIALFGAPRSHPDDPQRAVMAAAAGLRAIESIGESRGYTLHGRAGVNTGVVIAGSVGLGRAKDYTVMGSAVNLAARLETAAPPGEVLVGPDTFEATRHALLYTPVPVSLRGFPDVAEGYRLLAQSSEHGTDPYAELSFVGRHDELNGLRCALERITHERSPRQLWLTGEAGIGKTRLLREFVTPLAVRVLWLEERLALGEGGRSWQQLAAQLFSILPSDDPQLKRQKIAAQLQSVGERERTRWQHAILESLSAPTALTDRRGPRGSTATAWAELLASKATADPNGALVLVVEGGPKDSAMEQTLATLLATPAPLLILRTSRNRVAEGETVPAEQSDLMMLRPLSLADSLTLMSQLASPLLKVATEALVVQAGGIPAYILELGRALSSAPTGSFSGSLASLLQARLDMLSPPARHLLAQAALTGERFWAGLLAQFAEGDSDATLRLLVGENLLVQEASSSLGTQVEYRFQSELLRRALLRMIPFRDRPNVHYRIAAWLEQHAPASLSRLTAEHFEKAGALEAAYPHYLAAADQARSSGESDHAYRLLSHLETLELAPEFKAEAALTHAQLALHEAQPETARKQLEAAAGWLERCTLVARCAELSGILESLRAQLPP